MFIAESLEICDPVLAFDEIMEEIGIERYLKPEGYKPLGRPGYCRVNMLKTILFGFMDTGYAALRELEDRCKVNLRYMYLMDYETPSYHCFGDFINEELTESIEEIFRAVMEHICEKRTCGHAAPVHRRVKVRGKRKQVHLGMEKGNGESKIPVIRKDHKIARRNE